MTREQFARECRWNTVMLVIGFVNVAAIVPQPLKIYQAHQAGGVSIMMFLLFIMVQAAVAIESFIKRSYGLMWSMVVSALLSVTTIGLALIYR